MTSRLACAAALALAAAPALAQSGEGAFRSPSGNISCMAAVEEGASDIRCDLREADKRSLKRPRDCDLDYGSAFLVAQTGRGKALCAGDTVADPAAAVLGYGQRWRLGGIACLSSPSGMTCKNAQGHGFEISRRGQRVF